MKKTGKFLPYDLQFFAEDGEGAEVGANETEAAEQSSEEVSSEGAEESVTEEAANPQPQSDEANRAFANMRRELEAARRQAAELDRMYAEQYKGYTNPETGQPIRSARDYAEAMSAQTRMQARQKLQENNIDPQLIDNMIANSPVVRQAEAATAELNSYRAQQMIDEDMKKVLAIDSSKTSKEDIYNDPSYGAVLDYIGRHPGTRFDEAYKLVNFDRLSGLKTAAAKQAVVNQVKGQAHLSNASGVTSDDGLEDIPSEMMENFKDLFPGRSMKELKALYNKTLQSRR